MTLVGSSSIAIFWMTREDIGNAEIPDPPIMGLSSFSEKIHEFRQKHAADRVHDKGKEADGQDHQRINGDQKLPPAY